ncbi:MAG: AAA family ATPase [Pyrinomonadaceae bacterium]
MSVYDTLNKLKGVKRSGDGWIAFCCAHDDNHHSLGISEKNGRVLLFCHAGCSYDEIIAALGIGSNTNSSSHIVAVYPYCDESRTSVYEAVRLEPKDFRQRRPDGKGGYIWKLNGTRRVPYRLPELLASDKSLPVFIPEGEKDCNNLANLGLIATTNVGGAKKWRDEYSEYLRGRDVVILPDNDEPGREHAQQVARSLHGIAASVKIINLPDLQPKGDVSDWLDAGGTVEQLHELVNAAPLRSESADKTDETALSVVRMADVEAQPVSWLWLPYIALGKLTILEGDPGLGKSWLTCAIAAAVSCGRGLPGAEPCEPSNVLMLSAEDGLADTLRPRLDAVGANVSRVFALAEPLTFDTPGLIRLEASIIEHQPKLVIIDPLFAFTGGKVDIHRANECRAISAPLAAIAERQGCAIVAVRHLGKSRGGGHALNAGIGSVDFAAAARSVLLVGVDPDEPHKRAIVQIKNNLAPHGEAIGYTLEDSQFYWTGSSTLTAGRILSLPSDEEERGARSEAEDFLRDALSDGPRASKEIKTEARQAGISEITLRRAKDKLGIRAKKDGLERWLWTLPEDAHLPVEDAQGTGDEHLQPNHTSKATYSNNLGEDAHVSVLEHLQTPDEHLQGWTFPPDLDPNEFDARCAQIAKSQHVSPREAARIVLAEHQAASTM